MFRKFLLFLCLLLCFCNLNLSAFASTENYDEMQKYMQYVEHSIKSNWKPSFNKKSYSVVMRFKIARNGELQDYSILQSSNNAIYDNYAIEALRKSAPFNPLPATYQHDKAPIQFSFDYNVIPAKNRKPQSATSVKPKSAMNIKPIVYVDPIENANSSNLYTEKLSQYLSYTDSIRANLRETVPRGSYENVNKIELIFNINNLGYIYDVRMVTPSKNNSYNELIRTNLLRTKLSPIPIDLGVSSLKYRYIVDPSSNFPKNSK